MGGRAGVFLQPECATPQTDGAGPSSPWSLIVASPRALRSGRCSACGPSSRSGSATRCSPRTSPPAPSASSRSLALHHNRPKPTLRIDLGDEAIVATPIHRFWKAGRGWAMARDLKPGDTIRTPRRDGPGRLGLRGESPAGIQPRGGRGAGASSSAPRAPWCTTTAWSIRSRSVRCPEDAGGEAAGKPLRGRSGVGSRSRMGSDRLGGFPMRATPAQPSARVSRRLEARRPGPASLRSLCRPVSAQPRAFRRLGAPGGSPRRRRPCRTWRGWRAQGRR